MEDRYKIVFSEERINSYKSIEEHDLNLELISNLTKTLAVIEIILRNRINNLKKKSDKDWLFTLYRHLEAGEIPLSDYGSMHRKLQEVIHRIDTYDNAANEQVLSRMSFGFWIKVVPYLLEREKYDYRDILNVEKINLLDYSSKNQRINDNNLKLVVILNLILCIRNRAFHWENLLKMGKRNKKGHQMPKIYIKIANQTNGVYPDRIKKFVNDILDCFGEEILENYKTPDKGENRY